MYDKWKIFLFFFILLVLFFGTAFLGQYKQYDENIRFNIRKLEIVNFLNKFFISKNEKKIQNSKKLFEEKKYAEGLNILNSIPEKCVNDFKENLYYLKGVGYLKTNNIKEAKENFILAHNLRPRDIKPLEELSNIYLNENLLKEVENCLQEILYESPDNEEAKIKLAQIYDRQEKESEKIKVLESIQNYKDILLIKKLTNDKLLDSVKYLSKLKLNEPVATSENEKKEILYFYKGESLNIKLEENSMFVFEFANENKIEKLKIKFIKGSILVVKKNRGVEDNIEFLTPVCKVVPRESVFWFKYNELANSVNIQVLKGVVLFMNLIGKSEERYINEGENFNYKKEVSVTESDFIKINEYRKIVADTIKKIDYSRAELQKILKNTYFLEKGKEENLNWIPKDEAFLFAYRYYQNAKNCGLEYKYLKRDSYNPEKLNKKRMEALSWTGKAKKLFQDIMKNKKVDGSAKKDIYSNILKELDEIEEAVKYDK